MAKSYKEKFRDEDGVWRTIGGRRVFIRTGQSLSDAMKESGKFKKASDISREEYKNKSKEIEYFNKRTAKARDEYYDRKFAQNESFEYQADISDLEGKHISKEQQLSDIGNYYEEQERQALRSKDMTYGYSKKALENISNKELDDYIKKQEELVNEYTNRYNQDLTYDQRKTRNKQDTIWDRGMKTKYEHQLKKAQEEKTRREQEVNKYFSVEEPKDELKEISGGAISTLQTTTPKSKADRLKPGTEIYYTGDQANIPGYFTVEKFEPEKEQYLTSVTLKEKGGQGRTFKIGSQLIASEYGKDPGARFSFKEDYDNYRNKIFEGYRKQAEEREKEYKLYKKAMTDPDSIDPMTENSTDWEALDKKYRDKYNKELSKAQKQDEILNEWGATDKARKMIEEENKSVGQKTSDLIKDLGVRTFADDIALKDRYSGTYDYLKQTTNMSGNEILELLKKIEQDKK